MSAKKSKISKIFFFFVLMLAVLAMVGFGLTGIFSQSISASVATVGKVDVSADDYFRSIQNEISSVSQQFGTQLTIDQALLFGLDRSVLQRLITQAAYENEAQRLGVSVGDETVKNALLSNPGFQGLTGTFDEDVYKDSIDRSGMTPSQYEALIRADSSQLLIQAAVSAGVNLPEEAALAIFDYIGESRGFTYARVGANNIAGAIPAPTDSELAAYYSANPEAFTQPLTRQITYVSLTPEMVAETLEISEERIAALYEERSTEYNTPAKRFVERIVLGSQAEATAARDGIDAGDMTFEQLADTRGLTLADIDLGDVTARDVGAAAAEVLFASEEPGIYGPVDTNIGPAIFRMNAAISALSIPLEEVQDDLRRELAIEDASFRIADVADAVIDLIAGGASLEEVADETDMQLDTIDLAEGQADGIAAYAAFREEASASEIGEERDILDLEDGGVFALRVDGITESFVKPMSDVTQAVLDGQQNAKTHELMLARAEQIVKAIGVSNGGSLSDFGGSLLLEDATEVTRTSTIPDLPPSVIEKVFALEIGNATVIEDVYGAVIIELNSVAPFDPESDQSAAILEQVNAQQTQQVAQDLLAYFGAALVTTSQPTLNQARIDSLHQQLNYSAN
ncbi:MAG: SurA N-terminal domain-containing protein [Rhodobacteraceae bacterium]|nr:SurA N-terminal domain-containing protein [Paracoccaceae bacterium]